MKRNAITSNEFDNQVVNNAFIMPDDLADVSFTAAFVGQPSTDEQYIQFKGGGFVWTMSLGLVKGLTAGLAEGEFFVRDGDTVTINTENKTINTTTGELVITPN